MTKPNLHVVQASGLLLPPKTTTIEIGDVVGLKSGGPLMTAVAFENDLVACAWTCNIGQLHMRAFPKAALTKKLK